MKKSILISIMLMAIPAILFAGTVFEDEKRTSDPYVADRGGFNSLFVNPAGAAGQSGFELSVHAGGMSTSNDIKLVSAMTDMAMGLSGDPAEMDELMADVGTTLSDLYDSDVITVDMLNAIFDGTTLDPDSFTDWDDPSAVLAQIEDPAFDSTIVETNVDAILNDPASPQYADFYNGIPSEVSVDVVAGMKTGFLIKGVGLGIYDHAVAVAAIDPDPVDPYYGLNTIYNELGVIAGFGFNIMEGKFALGMSGNYGILMRNTDPLGMDNFDDIINTSVNYGYTWGVDLGLIWRPTPALGVGLVLNDVVGYTEADTPYTAAGIEGFIDEGAYFMDNFDYEVTMDLDVGLSWQPDWRFVDPKIGFDVYNVVDYARAVSDEDDDFDTAMYRLLNHMRLGAQFTFFDFLKIGAQYYDNYISAGLGLDLLFLELYGEFKIEDQFVYAEDSGDIPLGADLMVRIHF